MDEKVVVLAVDDTPYSLDLLNDILSLDGYRTRTANSGELALEFLKNFTPDLILLDMNMPGIDGLDVCRRIKAEPRTSEIPVIFLSGELETFKQVEGFKCGAIDFITKPYNTDILLMRVRTHLELSRLRRQARERVAELELAHENLRSEMDARNVMQVKMIQQDKMASIGQLSAGVAHEINNPMGYITSNLVSLGKYLEKITEYLALSDSVIEQLDSVDKNEIMSARSRLKINYVLGDAAQLISESLEGAIRVKNIVNDLKSLSRNDKNELLWTDVNSCIESSLNIACNEIKYVADIDRQFGEVPQILCHPQQLSQVFINLLTNAGQAIEGHGTVTVRTWSENDSVSISVTDTGKGIPEEVRQRIFDPFFTTKEIGKGTGLGLSISYDIISKHGGEITVESEVGSGTTFIVRLPIEPPLQKNEAS